MDGVRMTYDQAMTLVAHGHEVRRRGWANEPDQKDRKDATVFQMSHGSPPAYGYQGVTRWKKRRWRPSPDDREAGDWEDLGFTSWWDQRPSCACAACCIARRRAQDADGQERG